MDESTVPRGPLRVTQFNRRPHVDMFSLERVFERILPYFPARIEVRRETCRFESHGLFRRTYDILEAFFRQGEVNHVTGDVHFLTYLMTKRKTLLTSHGCVLLNQSSGWRRRVYWFFWYWLPARRCALITTVSRFSRTELLGYLDCDPSKVRIVYNPVFPAFRRSPKDFNERKPVILQMGTKPVKNLPRVAQALEGLSCHLRVIGRLSEQQVHLLKKHGIEHSSAFDLSEGSTAEEYRACDLVVFASTYEAGPLIPIEAHSVGRPLVTSRIGPLPEIAGDAACFVDPLDPASIREGVEKVIRDGDYREDLVRKGFVNAGRFLPEKIAMDYTLLYEELAGKRT